MAEKKFMELIDQLEQEIAQATDDTRHEIQAELHKTVEKMRLAGLAIPARLKDLDTQAVDEEIEDRFDNMPI
ncbi:hypothetical protein [Thalassovita sp.]|uniref:hypothetical protein n=1 Tax=Thalassovita sp. TaxID=1979401 RepID=UPI00288254ED|nr:hypothetical protein [Thalassovita sp.]MDF1803160.1 hypothetical protein [Thalassovita sp.]